MDYNIVKPIWHIFKIYIKVRVILMNEKQRTMLQGMDMLMQKISKNLDSKTFTVLELIEMSNDVYSDIMENYKDEK